MTRQSLERTTASLGRALATIDSTDQCQLLAQCQRELRELSLSVALPRSQRKSAKALLLFVEGQIRGGRVETGSPTRPASSGAASASPQSRNRANASRPSPYEQAERFARLLQSIERKEKAALGSDSGASLQSFVHEVAKALRGSRDSMKELESPGDLVWFLRKAWLQAKFALDDCLEQGALLPSDWLQKFVGEHWLTDDEGEGCEFLDELLAGLIRRCEKTEAVLQDRLQLAKRAGLD